MAPPGSGALPAVDVLALPAPASAGGARQLPGSAQQAMALEPPAASGARADPAGGRAGHLVAEGAVRTGPHRERRPAPDRVVAVAGADHGVGDLVEDRVAHEVQLV